MKEHPVSLLRMELKNASLLSMELMMELKMLDRVKTFIIDSRYKKFHVANR